MQEEEAKGQIFGLMCRGALCGHLLVVNFHLLVVCGHLLVVCSRLWSFVVVACFSN